MARRVTHDGPLLPDARRDLRPRPVQARLPILIGGSGPTKTLRTTARYADLWNAYGSPERDGRARRRPATSAARRSAATVRGIERTVTVHAVLRDDRTLRRRPGRDRRPSTASTTGWARTGREHGLSVRRQPAGGARPTSMATAGIGVDEVIVVFRAPFDHETIERIGEVRAALDG